MAWIEVHQLYDGADLAVTTDYRQVLSEILISRLENPNLDYIFPGYQGYQPMGLVRGNVVLPPGLGSKSLPSGGYAPGAIASGWGG